MVVLLIEVYKILSIDIVHGMVHSCPENKLPT